MNLCKLLEHTLVMVRLDYCNALLCGAREDVKKQLERLQRQAARVVCKKYKTDHNYDSRVFRTNYNYAIDINKSYVI